MCWISLVRVNQWYKNLLCLLLLLSVQPGVQLTTSGQDLIAIIAAFCLAASAVYVFNDLMDRQKDSHTADRQHRPLASGAIKPFEAALMIPVLIIGSVSIAPDLWTVSCLGLYWLVNLAYNLWIKRHFGYGLASALTVTACYVIRMMPAMWLEGVNTSRAVLLMSLVAMVAFSLVVWKQRSYLLNNKTVRSSLKILGVISLSLVALLLAPYWGVLTVALYPVAVYGFVAIFNAKGTREPLRALWQSYIGTFR